MADILTKSLGFLVGGFVLLLAVVSYYISSYEPPPQDFNDNGIIVLISTSVYVPIKYLMSAHTYTYTYTQGARTASTVL